MGTGDLLQQLKRGVITSRLVLSFLDGSMDDETAVYTQQPTLRLLSDHHVQHGPSFPKASDVVIDAAHGGVRTRDDTGNISETVFDMPADT